MRTFAPSNKPGTCLWCGRKLLCRSPERGLERKIKLNMRLYVHSREKAEAETLPSHEYWKDRYGKHNGLFCTDSCAVDFACAAARNGYRLSSVGRKA